MKRSWTQPVGIVQQFEANEAVSACSADLMTFQCNTTGKPHVWYNQTGTSATLVTDLSQVSSSTKNDTLGTCHKCGKTHGLSEDGQKVIPADVGLGWIDVSGPGRTDGVYDEGDTIVAVWAPGFSVNPASFCSSGGADSSNLHVDYRWQEVMRNVARS